MALKKNKIMENGLTASYHKIRSIEIMPYEIEETVIIKNVTEEEKRKNPSARPEYKTELKTGYEMLVVIDSYANQEIRKKGVDYSAHTMRKTKTYPKEGFDSSNIFQRAYELAKEDEFFAGAEDC
jgi:hypothetical protein